jgi:aspartyl/asparaginyl-tRNA synthetase
MHSPVRSNTVAGSRKVRQGGHTVDRVIDGLQMLEPELAFADLKDDMACAEAYLQHVVSVQSSSETPKASTNRNLLIPSLKAKAFAINEPSTEERL